MTPKLGAGSESAKGSQRDCLDDQRVVFAATLQDVAEMMSTTVRLVRRTLQSSSGQFCRHSYHNLLSEDSIRATSLLADAMKDFESLVADLGTDSLNFEETQLPFRNATGDGTKMKTADVGPPAEPLPDLLPDPLPDPLSDDEELELHDEPLEEDPPKLQEGTDFQSEPIQLGLLPCWDKPMVTASVTAASLATSGGQHLSNSLKYPQLSPSFDDQVSKGSCTLKPDSKIRMAFDILALLAVLYDLITVPLYIFDYNDWQYAASLQMVICIIWTIELPMNFFFSYHADGLIETRKRKIARKYILRGWFLPDITLVGMDWFSIFAGSALLGSSGAPLFRMARITRITRVIRLARLLRLMRAFKLQEIFGELSNYIFTDTMTTMMQVAKLTGFIYFFCHIVGCAWYFLGLELSNNLDVHNWVNQVNGATADRFHRYLVSVRLVFAQFTPAPPPGFGNVSSHVYEELFNLLLLLIGFGLFSAGTGSVTANYIAMQKQKFLHAEQKHALRRYLKQHHVSLHVGNQIMTWYGSRPSSQKLLYDKDVHAIQSLPPSLRANLRLEVYGHTFSVHPLFYQLMTSSVAASKEFCVSSVTQLHFAEGDIVCHMGQDASMIFVRHSNLRRSTEPALEYITMERSQSSPIFRSVSLTSDDYRSSDGHRDDQRVFIDEGGWFCEVALWLAPSRPSPSGGQIWTHCAPVVTLTNCVTLHINTTAFFSAMSVHPKTCSKLCSYARLIIKEMQHAPLYIELWPVKQEVTRLVATAFNHELLRDDGRQAQLHKLRAFFLS